MHQRVPFTEADLHKRSIADLPGQERWDKASSGRWKCRLEVVTALCVKTAFAQQYNAKAKSIFVPGGSLRGMVRNAAETLGAGCGRFYDPISQMPRRLVTCSQNAVCMVCRTFGFVEGQNTWQSRVRFTDAISPTGWTWELLDAEDRRSHGGASPENERGWALFVHEQEDLAKGRIPCIAAGAMFDFGVEYQNLDAEEFAVFRLALTLQSGAMHLVHKLGFAKSLGLGSCRVSIMKEPEIKDATRKQDVERHAARYSTAPEFQEIARWRTVT